MNGWYLNIWWENWIDPGNLPTYFRNYPGRNNPVWIQGFYQWVSGKKHPPGDYPLQRVAFTEGKLLNDKYLSVFVTTNDTRGNPRTRFVTGNPVLVRVGDFEKLLNT